MLLQEQTDFQLDHLSDNKDDEIEAELNLSNITYETLPASLNTTFEGLNDTSIDSSSLQQVGMLRKSFEQTSQSSTFTYGESFRQRQHQDKLGEKENQKMAKEAIHGFAEVREEAAVGLIDCSPLAKTFAFEPTKENTAPDESFLDTPCEESKYKTAVFVVHQTRGMLLLQQKIDGSNQEMAQIPGGSITEDEITKAASKSSHFKMQLQFAGREEAARYLYEQTRMDVRGDLERLQPAVLHLEPPIDNDGLYLLRNEVNDSLFYLLQTDQTEDHYAEAIQSDTEHHSVIYVREPKIALDILECQGGVDSAVALEMIIQESAAPATAPKTLEDRSVSEPHLLVQGLQDNEPAPTKKKKLSLVRFLRRATLCFRNKW